MAKVPPFNVDEIGDASNIASFATQVKKAFIDLTGMLLNLSPPDNFRGFMFEGSIAAGIEVKIINRLMKVPTGYLVVFAQKGTPVAGPTAWTKDYVYLKNEGASAITVRVFFFA